MSEWFTELTTQVPSPYTYQYRSQEQREKEMAGCFAAMESMEDDLDDHIRKQNAKAWQALLEEPGLQNHNTNKTQELIYATESYDS